VNLDRGGLPEVYFWVSMRKRKPLIHRCADLRTVPMAALVLLLTWHGPALSQTGSRAMGQAIGWVASPKAHGQWYVHWGYHRAEYGKTDLRLVGPGVDLTLHDMKATDMPSAFDPKVHLNPAAFTIPQFNARVGRKIHDGQLIPGSTWISAGWDHMKFKVPHTTHQVSGYLDSTVYDGDTFDWAWRDFNFEHSDGMNFIRIAFERNVEFGRSARTRQTWDTANRKWRMGLQTASSIGVVLCATDVRWQGIRTKHYWRIGGWGVSSSFGMWLQYGRFRALGRVQAGWINMGNSDFLASSDLSGETPVVEGVEGALLDASYARHAMTFLEKGVTIAYLFGRSEKPMADERVRMSMLN